MRPVPRHFRGRKSQQIQHLTANRLTRGSAVWRADCRCRGPAVGATPPRGAATRDLRPGLGILCAESGILGRQPSNGFGEFVDRGQERRVLFGELRMAILPARIRLLVLWLPQHRAACSEGRHRTAQHLAPTSFCTTFRACSDSAGQVLRNTWRAHLISRSLPAASLRGGGSPHFQQPLGHLRHARRASGCGGAAQAVAGTVLS